MFIHLEPKPKRKIQQYDRHSVADIDTVVALINGVSAQDRKPKAKINGQMVGISSLRLRTFAQKGTTCVKCGAQATYFALERDLCHAETDSGYHLNLWGEDYDGEPMIFTHDHILARALGGKDRIENTQTMCCHCNWEKGDTERIVIDNIRAAEAKKNSST